MADLINDGDLHRSVNAIIARLRAGFPVKHFDIQLVPALMSPAELKRVVRRTPCLLLAWSKIVTDASAGRTFTGDAAWVVYLITRNEAGTAPRFLGDDRGAGLFAMIQAAVALLHGFTVEDLGTLRVGGVTSSYAEGWGDEATVLATLDLSLPLSVTRPHEEPADFLTLATGWKFDGTDPDPSVPDDVESLVHLREEP